MHAISRLIYLSAALILIGAALPSFADTQKTPAEQAIFAEVGKEAITRQAYEKAFATASAQKFYHGKPPEAEVAALQREVGNQMVNHILLTAEAEKRGLKHDNAWVKQVVDSYEARYQGNPQWQKERARILPEFTRRLEEDSLVKQLEESVRSVAAPAQEQVKKYFDSNPEKFTEPEQVKISLILLKIAPSQLNVVWEAAIKEAEIMVKQLRGKASFADLAKLRSGDESAEKGGDMGYVHRGMLPDAAQLAIEKLKPGQITDPIRLLEGIAVIRLDDRKVAKLVSFEQARERAAGLWQREESERAWKELIERLRAQTPVRIDESHYLPLKPAENQSSAKK